MAQVTDLVTKFSFAGSLSPLLSFNKGMGSAIKLSAAFGVALAAGAGAFTKWSSSLIQSLDPLAQLSKRSGVAIGRIQELSFVASQSGSDFATMQSSIASLSQTIGDAAIKGSDDFSRLGISVRDASGQVKNADQVMGEIGERFRTLNLSMMEQESIAKALGIDASLVQMLNLSSSELSELSKQAREYGTLTKAQGEQIIKYNDALNRQRFAVNAVKQSIAIGFAPILSELTENFTKLIAENKDWITNVASKTIEIAVEIGDALKNTAVFVFDFVDAITQGHGAMSLFIAAATVFLATNPLLAAITAIVLIVDDLVTAFTGGQSVIADFFQEFLGVDVVKLIQDIIDQVTELTEGLAEFLGLSEGHQPATINPRVMDEFDFVPGANGLTPVLREVNQTNTINVYSNDPNAAGRSVSDNLQNQLEDADTQTNVGGM